MRPESDAAGDPPAAPAPWDLPGTTDDGIEPRPWIARLPRPGPWSGSALRGLALLLAVTVAIAAYWAWSGRPRAVALAPTTLATGSPLPGADDDAAAATTPSVEPTGPAEPVEQPDATAPTETVVVHVAGLVARPGLVELPAGSRVADAVAAAGGVTKARAADSVNLARLLVDGEQIVVGPAAAAPARAGPAVSPGTGAGATSIPVDLNTADVAALDALPGIGPVLAARIVQWRVANGPFRSVDELGEVSGIGDAILGQLRALVRV